MTNAKPLFMPVKAEWFEAFERTADLRTKPRPDRAASGRTAYARN